MGVSGGGMDDKDDEDRQMTALSSRGGSGGNRGTSPDHSWKEVRTNIELCLQVLMALPGSAISRFFNLPAPPNAAESIWILRFNQKASSGERGERAFAYLMTLGCFEQFEVVLATDSAPKTALVREIEKVAYPKNR